MFENISCGMGAFRIQGVSNYESIGHRSVDKSKVIFPYSNNNN